VPFTIDDVRDLLRLLDQHPEWRSELRRHVLTDELLELPALMRQLGERVDRLAQTQERTAEQLSALTARVDALAEAQARTTEQLSALTARMDALAEAQARTAEQLSALTARVDALAEAQARTEARLEGFAEAQARTEARLGELAAAQARTEARLETLADRVQGLADRVGGLKGEALELRYARRAGAYFSPLARRLQVLDHARLADRLDDAVDTGQLTAGERTAVLQADVVLSGVRREDRAEIYLIVEVSAGIGPHDVERAAQRAGLLAKLGQPVLPVVAGEWIAPEAVVPARLAGVWQVLDGQAVPPTGRQSA
jgi:predicted nuclease with TOPRIM domain